MPKSISAPRILIEAVSPEINAGRYPAKRAVGETFEVQADIFMDGHDMLRASLAIRMPGEKKWREYPMTHLGNDRWTAAAALDAEGLWHYTIRAWPDLYGSWARDTRKKRDAGQTIHLELTEGGHLIEAAFARTTGEGKNAHKRFKQWLAEHEGESLADALLSPEAEALAAAHATRAGLTEYGTLDLTVDPALASFGAWYEMIPRSQGDDATRGSTFAECEARLPAIADMGFDVIYFTPIHPIGLSFRKGKNNSLNAGAEEPGSPYAIGGKEGGHKDVHPELGTLKDFKHFTKAANKHGMQVALDFAVQCSPDHPYVKQHPEWFSFRPDGTIKYAENPPKKYQDIVNVNFESSDAQALWEELRSIVLFWIDAGATIFRVDNPHTKPFAFWEWLIGTVKEQHPEIIFLSEAFTRPKVMYALAKLGFTQSYTYFTWRNTKAELTEYLTELTQTAPKDFFRPNFFPTTPDIFPLYLHHGQRAAFMVRLALAATLSGNYGMVNGYELCEGDPLPDGKGGFKEEYLDSEKYEYKMRDWAGENPYGRGNIRDFVSALNHIRRDNPCMREFRSLRFHTTDNDQVLFYSKSDAHQVVFFVVNLDPDHAQETHITLPLSQFGIASDASYTLEDLLLGHRWQWTGAHQHQRLDPATNPVAIFRIQR